MKRKVRELKGGIETLINIPGEKKQLKQFLEVINPDKNSVIRELSDDIGVSFLSMLDVSNSGRITNLQGRKLEQVKKGYTFFQEDDVLFAKITPCMENGKGALVKELENGLGFGSTEFFVLRADQKKINPKLLFYITRAKDLRKKAADSMTGASGHRRVPQAFIESFPVFIPSLTEQQRIVDQIEKIEDKISDLEEKLTNIPAQKEKVLKKYL